MAEGEPLALTYIPEVILKKRKHKEESIALTRKNQLELGQHGGKKKKVDDIKRPEQLVREFRDKELDLIRMEQRTKRAKSGLSIPNSKLLFVIRIHGRPVEREMEDNPVQSSNKWLDDLSKGLGHQLEAITVEGLKIVKALEGFILCNFVVSNRISDADGNWHVGAMATLIDDVGAAAIYSYGGHIKASIDFNISFFATAKIQEEVEVEAKVVGDKGRITSVIIEVRRKSNGELIALGKQWMASHNNSNKASKL